LKPEREKFWNGIWENSVREMLPAKISSNGDCLSNYTGSISRKKIVCNGFCNWMVKGGKEKLKKVRGKGLLGRPKVYAGSQSGE